MQLPRAQVSVSVLSCAVCCPSSAIPPPNPVRLRILVVNAQETTRPPVRSTLFKQRIGGLVVRWVTINEYPLLYVFAVFLLPCSLPFISCHIHGTAMECLSQKTGTGWTSAGGYKEVDSCEPELQWFFKGLLSSHASQRKHMLRRRRCNSCW